MELIDILKLYIVLACKGLGTLNANKRFLLGIWGDIRRSIRSEVQKTYVSDRVFEDALAGQMPSGIADTDRVCYSTLGVNMTWRVGWSRGFGAQLR